MHPPATMVSIPWHAGSYDEWLPRLAGLDAAGRATLIQEATLLRDPGDIAGACHGVLALAILGEGDLAQRLWSTLHQVTENHAELRAASCITGARLLLMSLQADPTALAGAEDLLLEAQSLEIPGKSAPIAGYLGLIARLRGDYPAAMAAFEAAQTALAQYGGTDEEVATIWNNQGLTELELGLDVAAAESFQQALQRFKRLGRVRHLASVAQNIGFIYLELKRYEEAWQFTNKALEWYAELGETSLNRLLTCSNMAAICQAMSRFDEADKILQTASDLLVGHPYPVAEQYLCSNRGSLAETRLEKAQAAGDEIAADRWRQEALEQYQQALDLAESHRLPQRLWKAQMRLGIFLTEHARGAMDRAWRLLEQARNSFLTQQGSLTGEKERRSFLVQQRGLYGALIENALSRQDTALAWSLAQEAKQAGWIAGLPGDFPTEPLPSLPYTHNLGLELLNVLWENDILGTQEGLLDYFVAEKRIFRFAYHPSRGVVVDTMRLSPPALTSLLSQWNDQLNQYEQTPVAEQSTLSLPVLDWLVPLSDGLLEGLPAYWSDLSTWIISPHGPLLEVPWLALLGPDQAPVIEQRAIQLVPYFAHLEPRRLERDQPDAPSRAVLLTGNAADLVHLQGELEVLSHVLQPLGVVSGPPAGVEVHAWLQEVLPSARILHFAGHGTFDPTDPLASTIETGTEQITVNDFLAGRLQGDHLELVTLAACETARLQQGAASLVEGFLRALLTTGTRSMLAGGWKVRDDATALFMASCYQTLLLEGSLAEGVRAGCLELRSAGFARHPYLWAGFQPWGTPRLRLTIQSHSSPHPTGPMPEVRGLS
ncbi:MAG: hypothetical protein GEEBNDBF_00320 [bacterium]|nr:hypothetical protein [bacterium]